MPSVTLAESAKLSQDMLLQGVIENVITTNQFFEVIPFMEIEGNALAYNRENALGDSQALAVGSTITAKAAATFTQVTSSLTTLIGDAEVNGLIQAARSNKNDQKAVQVASKSKSVGRLFQDKFINGTATAPDFPGLLALVAAGQTITADAAGDGSGSTTNGGLLTLNLLDILLDQVKDKDGQVDFIMLHSRELRKYYSILRSLGGASIGDVVTLPSGTKVPAYRGTPIFRNDWLPINQTKGSKNNCSTIFAGTFDDGSGTHGISGITVRGAAGLRVEEVGVAEAKDETITRVKWYTGLANFSQLGLAALNGVHP
jgi:hypothetical protein